MPPRAPAASTARKEALSSKLPGPGNPSTGPRSHIAADPAETSGCKNRAGPRHHPTDQGCSVVAYNPPAPHLGGGGGHRLGRSRIVSETQAQPA